LNETERKKSDKENMNEKKDEERIELKNERNEKMAERIKKMHGCRNN